MSKKIELKPENLQKAWDDTCSDGKKLLENLYPNYEFEKKIEFKDRKIYAFNNCGDISVMDTIPQMKGYCWTCLNSVYNGWSHKQYKTGEAALRDWKQEDIKVFDNQKDFFTWALKQIN